jgi:RNA methyltransferase, TrmH family
MSSMAVRSMEVALPQLPDKLMAISRLTSRNNPLLKTIRLVSSGSHRAPKGLAVAEGIRVLEELNHCNCAIEAVVISEGFGDSDREKSLLATWLSMGVPIHKAEAGLFASITDVKTPQGAVALVHIPELSLADIPQPPGALLLLACGIQDPGNLGTLIRTAAAAGATLVGTTNGTVSVRNPKTIRASAGTCFRLPIVEHVDEQDFLLYCARHSIRAYRTDVCGGLPYSQADLSSSCAILLGNEGSGIAQKELEALPAIHIPMAAGVESLNVAMAGGIFLYEARRQRSR